jgi:tRNA(Arg) A34 adenosine deaminase TadA
LIFLIKDIKISLLLTIAIIQILNMPKIQVIVDRLRMLALSSQLNKRHAAAVVIGSKIITSAANDERTHNKVFAHLHRSSVCCSTHAEIGALRKARSYLCGQRPRILQD